jgi:hypothetical protein
MFILIVETYTQSKKNTFVQLRDEHMRLLSFFHPSKLDNMLEHHCATHLKPMIEKVLENAKPGKLYQI